MAVSKYKYGFSLYKCIESCPAESMELCCWRKYYIGILCELPWYKEHLESDQVLVIVQEKEWEKGKRAWNNSFDWYSDKKVKLREKNKKWMEEDTDERL